MTRKSASVLLVGLCLPFVASVALERTRPDIRPRIPEADRSAPGRVFLEHADRLYQDPADTFLTVAGDVLFSKEGMELRCDSAHFTQSTGSMSAFGNVVMTSGDTLRITADELDYNGVTDLATLYAPEGGKVRMTNRDVTLETDIFYYDMGAEVAYYLTGGVLFDPSNTLVSIEAEYLPSTKEALFYRDVHLFSRNTSDTLDIYSDTLYYNSATRMAELYSPSRIINRRGVVNTTLGVYQTDSNIATFYNRSEVSTPQGRFLVADTIYYDKQRNFDEAFGDMVLTDTVKKISLRAEYGYYDNATDSAFATGRAMLAEYSGGDTLFLHAEYIRSFRRIDSVAVPADTITGREASVRMDTAIIARAYPRVRFFRSDLQGVCDTMTFFSRDSSLTLSHNPVVWSEDRQIFGEVIILSLNDSTIERALLPNNGFMAQHIEADHYNQMSGKKMEAFFVDNDLRRLEIDGNVEFILYPEEADSTINKLVNGESSFLTAEFLRRAVQSVRMWPQTSGKVIPLFLARRADYFLPKFKWFGPMRPLSKDDIFTVPAEMEELMGTPAQPEPWEPRGRLLTPQMGIPREPETEVETIPDATPAAAPEEE